MANTIKFKRGSGSDPGTSDLSVGEIAIRTDTAKLFTKNDAGSVVSVSGGVEDGDKGDITVSSSGSVFTIDSGVVTSAKIANDTIVNADINSSAAIDGSKISPAFTSDITGTGNLTLTSTDAGSSAAPELELYRNSSSPADADYLGQLKFTGESDDGSKEVYAKITGKIDDASSGTEDGIIEIAHRKAGSNVITGRFKSTEFQLLNGTGLSVNGNISTDGTVDGRDVAADGTKLDGIESGATADQTKSDIDALGIAASTAATLATARNIGGVSFNGSANINLPGVNTSGNQDTSGTAAIATTITVADESSDTSCNVLFATAATGNLAPKSGTNLTFNSSSGVLTATGFAGALTGNVTGNASGSSGSCTGNAATATALETARTIAGVSFDGTANISLNNNAITNGAGYITATLTNEQVQDIVGGMLTGNTETGITVTYQDSDGTLDFVVASQTDENFTTTLKNKLDGIESGATADQSASEIVALIADQTIAPSTIDMEDDEKILLGTGDDLQIYHSGSHAFVNNTGSGLLILQGNGSDDVSIRAVSGESGVVVKPNAAVELYYDNTKRAETVSGGFTVTGTCTATTFSGSGASLTSLPAGNLTGTLPAIDGSNLTGISAGATGGGSDEIFYENGQNVTTDYTITNGKNAMSAGPITINSGVTVTVGAGETLTIV